MADNNDPISRNDILIIIAILTYVGGFIGTIATINSRMNTVAETVVEIKTNAAKMNESINSMKVDMGKLQVEIRRMP